MDKASIITYTIKWNSDNFFFENYDTFPLGNLLENN